MTTAYLFSGFPGCGKSTALNEAYRQGLHTIEMSEIVRQEHEKMVEKDNRISDIGLLKFSEDARGAFGPTVFSKSILKLIELTSERPEVDTVAIAGVRSGAEVEHFQSSPLFDDVICVGIRCNEDVRFDRLNERDGIGRGAFSYRNEVEERLGLQKVLNRYSDIILRNNSCTEERFRTKIQHLV